MSLDLNRQTTIKDVAIAVGVSNAAVSAVLGRRSSGHVRVSDATRARIIEAATRLNYQTNQLAVSLRYRQTNLIGIYSSHGYLNPDVIFTSKIIGGVHAGANDNKKDLLLHGSYRNRGSDEIYSELAGGRIDGLILYTSSDDPLIDRLTDGGLPVVAMIDSVPKIPSVVVDDEGGARQIAALLSATGHRRVFYQPGRPFLNSAVNRRNAFVDEASKYGISITMGSDENHIYVDPTELDWLSAPRENRPTAIACWNDETAYNVLEECYRRGIRVPEDVAVLGFDDIPPSHGRRQRVTSIHAPWVDVARESVNVLVKRLEGESIPLLTVLPVTLVRGETI